MTTDSRGPSNAITADSDFTRDIIETHVKTLSCRTFHIRCPFSYREHREILDWKILWRLVKNDVLSNMTFQRSCTRLHVWRPCVSRRDFQLFSGQTVSFSCEWRSVQQLGLSRNVRPDGVKTRSLLHAKHAAWLRFMQYNMCSSPYNNSPIDFLKIMSDLVNSRLKLKCRVNQVRLY